MRTCKQVLYILTFLIIYCTSFAEIDVFVDPGHGGTDPGSTTYISNYNEDNINLQISLLLQQYLELPPVPWTGIPYTVAMSRTIDTTISLWKRCQMANDLDAKSFVSVHHNSAVSCPDGSDNRSEVLFSTFLDECVYEEYGLPFHCEAPKDTTDSLAIKIGYRFRDTFGKKYDEIRNPIDQHDTKRVLSRTEMASVITEASFICDTAEADSFYYNYDNHREWEAQAIWEGVSSFLSGQGIGRVDYHYNRLHHIGIPVYTESPEPIVYVDTVNWDIPERVYEVPFQTCWLLNEFVRLEANEFSLTYNQGLPHEITYDYTFHHWEKKWYTTNWNLETFLTKKLWFQVPWDFEGDHYYIAYFTGGPYKLEIVSDPIPDVDVGDVVTLNWTVDAGVDSTTIVSVQVQHDNSSWVELTTVPWYYLDSIYSYSWTVTGIGKECLLKLVATDTIGNTVETMSNQFSIFDPSLDPDGDFIYANDNCPYNYNPAQSNADNDAWGDACDNCDSVYTTNQSDSDGDGFGDACDLCPDFFTPGGWNNQDADNDGVGNGCDNCVIISNTDQSDIDNDGIGDLCDIDTSCTQPPIAAFDIDTIFIDEFGLDIRAYVITTIQSEPNIIDSSLWNFGDGTILYYSNVPNRYENYGSYTITLTVWNDCGMDDTTFMIIYHCPLDTDSDNDGIGDACDNCPTFYNPSQMDSDGNGAGDACCCVGIRGNIDGDSQELIDISDLPYLISFMFDNPAGPAPPCFEEGDLDADGIIDVSDLVYLVDYMFTNGPDPAVCP